jgi:hypothetical protein
VLRYFIANADAAFEQGRTDEGARFAGTPAHALEWKSACKTDPRREEKETASKMDPPQRSP